MRAAVRGAAAKVLGRTGSEGVRAPGDIVNKVHGRAACELRFANPERILRIGVLHTEICRLVPFGTMRTCLHNHNLMVIIS